MALIQLLRGLLDAVVEVTPVGEQGLGHTVEAQLQCADFAGLGRFDCFS